MGPDGTTWGALLSAEDDWDQYAERLGELITGTVHEYHEMMDGHGLRIALSMDDYDDDEENN